MVLSAVLEGFEQKTGIQFLTFRLSTKREHYYIGRQADAVDIHLEHQSISRRHAELSITPVGVLIADLDTAHGTFVNGVRLKPHVPTPLADGTTITFAASTRRYRFRSAASIAADSALGGVAIATGAGPLDPAMHKPCADPLVPTSLFPAPPINEALCKAVLYVLRHSRSDSSSNYRLRPDGFAAVDELVRTSALSSYHATLQDMDDLEHGALVAGQRLFERRDDGGRRLIRAVAGHVPALRVNTALGLSALSLSELGALEELVHATLFRCWNAIRSEGLATASGVVYFGTELPPRGAVLPGMSAPAQVLVCVDAQAMLAAGLRFFRDGHGAICCPGDDERGLVPLHFATRVLNARDGSDLLDVDELEVLRSKVERRATGPAQRPVAPATRRLRAEPLQAQAAATAGDPLAPAARFNPYLAGSTQEGDGSDSDGEPLEPEHPQRQSQQATRKRPRLPGAR